MHYLSAPWKLNKTCTFTSRHPFNGGIYLFMLARWWYIWRTSYLIYPAHNWSWQVNDLLFVRSSKTNKKLRKNFQKELMGKKVEMLFPVASRVFFFQSISSVFSVATYISLQLVYSDLESSVCKATEIFLYTWTRKKNVVMSCKSQNLEGPFHSHIFLISSKHLLTECGFDIWYVLFNLFFYLQTLEHWTLRSRYWLKQCWDNSKSTSNVQTIGCTSRYEYDKIYSYTLFDYKF